MKSMEKVLLSIAKALNENEVCWGIGGSLLLKRHDLIETVHDIDLVISTSSIEKAIRVLDKIAIRVPPPVKQEYGTKFFYQYTLDGVSVDVMAQFTIIHESGSYVFSFDQESLVDTVVVDDIALQYTSLEAWFVAYLLMKNRESKVAILRTHLLDKGVKYPGILEQAMLQPLPKVVEEEIKSILKA